MTQQIKGRRKSAKNKNNNKKKQDNKKMRNTHSDIATAVIETPPNPVEGEKGEEMRSTRDWSSLPTDIVCQIFSRMYTAEKASSIFYYSVHKAWQSASLLCPQPCLIYYHRTNDSWRFVNPFCRMQFDLPVPPELRGSKIRCCSTNGYLLVEQYRNNLCLFNPLTQEIVRIPKTLELPSEPDTIEFHSLSFSSDNSAVVGLKYTIYGSYIGIWKLGEQEWEIHTVDKTSIFYQLKGSIVSHKSKFYWVGADGGLAMFSTSNIEESWSVWDIGIERHSPDRFYAASYLVKSNGGLLGVFESYDGKIELYRLNERKRAWEQVKNVGRNQMLFLSYGSCFSKASDVKGLCNTIHFPKFSRANDSSSYMFYSATTKTFSNLDDESSTMDAGGLSEIRNSCWFVPVPDTR